MKATGPAALMSIALLAGGAGRADPVAGEALYAGYCAGCHGERGAGLATFSGDLAVFRARLTSTPDMPDMSAVLSDEEIADIFRYLDAARR